MDIPDEDLNCADRPVPTLAEASQRALADLLARVYAALDDCRGKLASARATVLRQRSTTGKP